MTLRCTCPDDEHGATIRCPVHGAAATHYPDPSDVEIARLKAEVVNQRHEIGMLLAALAAYQRALAAGPAALREGAPSLWSGEAAAREIERAQAEAMKEKP